MMAKENAPVRGGARTEAGRGGTARGKAHNSYNDFTTSATQRQRLSDYLGRGKSSAVTGQKLAERMGMGDLREISRLVERERNSLIPICATCDPSNPGYYLPCNVGELFEYNKILKRRIRAITLTQKAIETALERMIGQETIKGWSDG